MALTLRKLRILLMEAETLYGPNAPVLASADGLNVDALVLRLHDERHPRSVVFMPLTAAAPTRQLSGVAAIPAPEDAAPVSAQKAP